MITVLGELSISAAVPLLATLRSALTASLEVAVPDLQAKLTGLTGVLGAITIAPPDLAGTISAAIATVAQLQAAISGPTVTLEGPAIAGLIAELSATLDTLLTLGGLDIPDGTLSAYVYDGASASIGAELQAAVNASLPGAPGHCNALILVTTSPVDWTAATEVFAT